MIIAVEIRRKKQVFQVTIIISGYSEMRCAVYKQKYDQWW